MSTELARREDNAHQLNGAVADLVAWADSARAAHDVATQLCQTSFVPEAFQNKPHEATAAILSGMEVGLSPMAALRSFDIIQGVAAPRAATLRAIVQAAGHDVWVHESNNTRAIVRGQRRGGTKVEESKWDMDRAKQLGLAGKKNWREMPQSMLIARATSELCRLIASDAILGIGYTVEELADGEISSPPPEKGNGTVKRRTARRAPIAAIEQAPEPELEPPPQTDAGAATPTPPPADDSNPPESPAPASPGPFDEPSRPQMRMLHALFNNAKMSERPDRLAFASGIVGRDITSSNELTKTEVGDVITELQILTGEGE